MSALSNDSVFLSTDGLLFDHVHFCARFFYELRYSYVKRECNKVVHCLARHVLSILDFVAWMENVPVRF